MTQIREIDAYTKHVMTNIDPATFSSLNLLQIRAIETAISSNAPFHRHSIDLRGSIRLFFARFYFVILCGRDNRSAVRNREDNRRRQVGVVSFLMLFYTFVCMLVPVLLLILYVLKSLAGIDIFPDQHLSDILGFNEV